MAEKSKSGDLGMGLDELDNCLLGFFALGKEGFGRVVFYISSWNFRLIPYCECIFTLRPIDSFIVHPLMPIRYGWFVADD
jgi:hypothetical protein